MRQVASPLRAHTPNAVHLMYDKKGLYEGIGGP